MKSPERKQSRRAAFVARETREMLDAIRADAREQFGSDRKYEDLDWDLKTPCDDCPFRKSSPFHEGIAANAPANTVSILGHNFCHTCHKTDPRADCETSKRYRGRLKHCVGSLIVLLKTGRGFDLQLLFLRAIEDGKIDIHELTRIAEADRECFEDLDAFLRFQGAGLARLIAGRDAADLP